jgi:hypothetical protein
MQPAPTHDIRVIAEAFDIPGVWQEARPHGQGHINDTYAAWYQEGRRRVRYIHQRINHHIFRNPEAVNENIHRVTSHLRRKLVAEGSTDVTRETLTLIPTREGRFCHLDPRGNYWRTYLFIENSRSHEVVETPAQAREAAQAFGRFVRLLADLPGPRLHETIPGFHDTPQRFRTLARAVTNDSCNRARSAAPEIAFALQREPMASVLQNLHARGHIPERITHNDTKFNNILMDADTGRGLCVTDLDTVMPGLTLHDFGDMVRTTTSPAAEDEPDLGKVTMQMPMFEALVRGYLDALGPYLNSLERQHLAFAGKLITFEIGLRFLTDYLQGDIYFKTHRPGHNLDRCRTQFKLVQSMEEQEESMQALLSQLG